MGEFVAATIRLKRCVALPEAADSVLSDEYHSSDAVPSGCGVLFVRETSGWRGRRCQVCCIFAIFSRLFVSIPYVVQKCRLGVHLRGDNFDRGVFLSPNFP